MFTNNNDTSQPDVSKETLLRITQYVDGIVHLAQQMIQENDGKAREPNQKDKLALKGIKCLMNGNSPPI